MSSFGPDIVEMRQWLLSQWEPSPGAAILDAGCGSGDDLLLFGQQTDKPARLVGVNQTQKPLVDACSATREDARFLFSVADLAQPWPFQNASFDLVYCNNVLECLLDKQAFLQEAHRVLRPNGQIVCAHWDHDTLVIDGDDKGLVRKMVHAFSDWKQAWMSDADGWMGRRLWRTFQQSRLFRGELRPYVLTNTTFAAPYFGYQHITNSLSALARRNLVEQAEYEQFCDTLRRFAEHDEYFFSLTLYAFIGGKL